MSFKYTILVIFSSIVLVNSAKKLPDVDVLKCCRHDWQLVGELDNLSCAPGAGPVWLPLLYAPSKRQFMPNKVAPSNWNVIEKQPECDGELILVKQTYNKLAFFMFMNGSLRENEVEQLFEPRSFCIDKSMALICKHRDLNNSNAASIIQPKIKIKKCCGNGGMYSELNSTCVTINQTEYYNNINLKNISATIVSGFPKCEINEGFVIVGNLSDSIMKDDGSLTIKSNFLTVPPDMYCLEHVFEHESNSARVFSCPENVGSRANIIETDFRFTFYSLLLFLSALFLLATLVIVHLLPTSNYLQRRCQTYYVACLFIGDLLLAITQFSGRGIGPPFCMIMAVSIHFFFLAAFFWLNTMCFNIWWTFRDIRPTSLEKSQEVFRHRIFNFYAWGSALVIAGVAAILDNVPKDPSDSFLRPRFGELRCWFAGDMEIFYYFYLPMAILLAVNLLFFAFTAHQLTCGLWKTENVKSSAERATLSYICLKLVVVMGITWGADVFSWAVGGPNYVWIFTDMINALQGVLIFIAFVWQPQVLSAIKKFWSERFGRPQHQTGGPQHSTSSQGLPSLGDSVTNNTTTNTTIKIPMETVC